MNFDRPVTGKASAHRVTKYPFINALRGYAILMVITSHATFEFPYLPNPVKSLTSVGWYGVQMFFLISCVTLMMSWRSDETKGIASPLAFWTRRFFRIAPAYYLAALLYFYFAPPRGGFDLAQLLSSLTFINAIHPSLMPTVPERWTVVPGGWSIGVEFSFYIIFPLMVAFVRGVKSGLAFFAASIAMACLANTLVSDLLLARYGDFPTSQFIYYWLPNQMPVFALGTLLYLGINQFRNTTGRVGSFLSRRPFVVAAACAAVFAFLAETRFLAPSFSLSPLTLMPFHFACALIFMVFALSLALSNTILSGKAIGAIGEVSFSAYLLHFMILRLLSDHLPLLDTNATGYAAIGHFALYWAASVAVTFHLSKLSFRFIESPMIELGKTVSARFTPSRPAEVPTVPEKHL